MRAGFEITNEMGSVQIDERFKNFCLLQKFNGNTNTAMDTFGGLIGSSISYSHPKSGSISPIFCAYSSQYVVTATNVNQDSNYWYFTVYSSGPVGTGFTIHIYDGHTPTPSNAGLQLLNGSGEITFDAARKYLRIEQLVNASPGMGFNTYDRVSGRAYAGIATRPIWSYALDQTTIGTTNYHRIRYQIVGVRGHDDLGGYVMGAFTVSVAYSTIPISPSLPPYKAGPVLIADVTHY